MNDRGGGVNGLSAHTFSARERGGELPLDIPRRPFLKLFQGSLHDIEPAAHR
jgi:hypothetical protein